MPVGGKDNQLKSPHIWTEITTKPDYLLLFLPIDKDSHSDNRFNLSLSRIRTDLG